MLSENNVSNEPEVNLSTSSITYNNDTNVSTYINIVLMSIKIHDLAKRYLNHKLYWPLYHYILFKYSILKSSS